MRLLAPLVALIAAGPTAVDLAAQQRPLVDISPTSAAIQDAVLSPDGQWVAYRTATGISVVDTLGRFPVLLVGVGARGPFLWSPDSGTVYAVDGSNIVAAPRNGTAATVIARNVPGQSITLWDLDSAGAKLYGTRFDAATSTTHVFELRTSGAAPRADIVSRQTLMTDVCVDPSDRYLGFVETQLQPFSPFSLWRTDIDGTNPIDLLGTTLPSQVEGIDWADAGDTLVLTAPDANNRPQVHRLERATQTLVPLTSAATHRRTRLAPDRRAIVCEGIDGQGNGPALIPVRGGGLVYLLQRQRFTWSSPPSIDAGGTRVVFAAARTGVDPLPRLFRLDLDGEMLVEPRVALGAVVSFTVPVPPARFGVLFLGQQSPPFTLTGVQYDFDLGPGFVILALAPSSGGAVSLTVPLPNDPNLRGLRIGFQGLRADPTAQTGTFTRSGVFTIF